MEPSKHRKAREVKGVRGDTVLGGRWLVQREQERGMGTYTIADTRTHTQHKNWLIPPLPHRYTAHQTQNVCESFEA